MLYCSECAEQRLWPVTMFQSRGPCETCGKTASCSDRPSSMLPVPPSAGDEDEGCGCPFDYPYTCPACGHTRITNHCPHDGIQNPCPQCGWTDPGKETPLQFLGVTRPAGEAER